MNDIKTIYGRKVISTDSSDVKLIHDSRIILADMSQYIGYEKSFKIFIDGHEIEISNIFELEENRYYGFHIGDKLYYAKRSDHNSVSFLWRK